MSVIDSTNADPFLQVTGLCIDVRSASGMTRVVRDVTFNVEVGRTVALVGESGSGKSLTALSLMRLLPTAVSKVSGRIVIGGRDILSLTEAEMEDIRGNSVSMIFQDPMTSLNPAMTVGFQIAEAYRRHCGGSRKAAHQRAASMLDELGVPEARRRATAYPHELSGGMQQRAMIAMALICRPKLLIADEPTTALDVTIQAQILDLLGTLQREYGLAILLITHDLSVVAEVCDEVNVLYSSQVVEQGPVESIFDQPRHPYTEGLLRSLPQVFVRTGELWSIGGTPLPAGAERTGCRFAPRCTHVNGGCTSTQSLLPIGDRGAARCHRADELLLKGTADVNV